MPIFLSSDDLKYMDNMTSFIFLDILIKNMRQLLDNIIMIKIQVSLVKRLIYNLTQARYRKIQIRKSRHEKRGFTALCNFFHFPKLEICKIEMMTKPIKKRIAKQIFVKMLINWMIKTIHKSKHTPIHPLSLSRLRFPYRPLLNRLTFCMHKH